jgi:HSP20 family molecular chaperone IbpA
MQSQQALERQAKTSPTSPILEEGEKLFEQMKDFSQSIAKRAYEFFEQRGRELGHEMEDWFRAEFELMRHIPVEMKHSNEQIIVRAETPGFTADDIKVSIEPRQIIISGKTTRQEKEETEKKVFSEFRADQFYRRLTLPAEVNPAKATASLKDGVLELKLTKAVTVQPVNVQIQVS